MSIKDQSHENEGFVSRWSRRKLEEDKPDEGAEGNIESESLPKIPLNTVMPGATTGRMSTTVEADRLKEELAHSEEREPILTDADMPEIDTLNEGSDFTGFMSPGVSDKLRKLALRKLFAGAGFNIRDGLDDYDEDFTNFAPLGDIVTCDMKHRAEVEEEKRLKALAESEAADESVEHHDEEALKQETLAAEEESGEALDQDVTTDVDEQDQSPTESPLSDDQIAAETDNEPDSSPHS
ncbi:MAG: DUF3306 domain-containing protein [Acidiferrobacterales bacterium]|nr:DUF3306 domain-containing protein [Acidiferrobacterales bacterium]